MKHVKSYRILYLYKPNYEYVATCYSMQEVIKITGARTNEILNKLDTKELLTKSMLMVKSVKINLVYPEINDEEAAKQFLASANL